MRTADPQVPGPKLSDDIQLTYQLDDVGFTQRGSYGTSIFVPNVGNKFGGIDLHVLSPGGILVRDIFESVAAGGGGDLATIRTRADEINWDPFGAFPRDVPDSPQIAEGPIPLSKARSGYINFFLSGYIFVIRDHPFAGSGGFFVRFGRHLQAFNNQVGQTSGMTILYDELLRDEGQPPPGP